MCVVSLVFAKRVVRAEPVGREGFLETAVIKIGRMTNITEVLVQINKSNKREGKKLLAQGWVVRRILFFFDKRFYVCLY